METVIQAMGFGVISLISVPIILVAAILGALR